MCICLLTSTGLPGEPRKGPRLSASCIPTEALAPHRPGGLGASAAPRTGPAGSPRWKRCLCRDLWDSRPSISRFVPANRGHAEPSGGAESSGVRTGVRAGRPPSCWARVRAGSGSRGGRGARPAVRPSDTLFSCRAVVRLRVPAPFRSLLRVRARSWWHRVDGEQHVSGGGGREKSHSVGFQFQTRGEQANPALRRGPSAGRAQRVRQTEGRARAPSAQRDQGRGEGPGQRRPGGCERARLAGLRLRSCCRGEEPGLWAVPGPGGPEASDSGRT